MKVSSGAQRSLLQSRTEEAAQAEQNARQDVATRMQHEVERRLAQQSAELRQVHEAQMRELTEHAEAQAAQAAEREQTLERQLDVMRNLYADEQGRAAGLKAELELKDRDRADDLKRAKERSERALAKERQNTLESSTVSRVLDVQVQVLAGELRHSERSEKLAEKKAEAVVEVQGEAAAELNELRQVKQELLQEEEELTQQLTQAQEDKTEAKASYAIAQRAATHLVQMRHAKKLQKLELEHTSELERAEQQREVELRDRTLQAAQVLQSTVGRWEGALQQAQDREAQALREAQQEKERVENELAAVITAEKRGGAVRIVQQTSRLNRAAVNRVEKTRSALQQVVDKVSEELIATRKALEFATHELSWLRRELKRAATDGAAAVEAVTTEMRQSSEALASQTFEADLAKTELEQAKATNQRLTRELADERAAAAFEVRRRGVESFVMHEALRREERDLKEVGGAAARLERELEKLRDQHARLKEQSEATVGEATQKATDLAAAKLLADEEKEAAESARSRLATRLSTEEEEHAKTHAKLEEAQKALAHAQTASADFEKRSEAEAEAMAAAVTGCEVEMEGAHRHLRKALDTRMRERNAETSRCLSRSLREQEEAWTEVRDHHESTRSRLELELSKAIATAEQRASQAAANNEAELELRASEAAAALAEREAHLTAEHKALVASMGAAEEKAAKAAAKALWREEQAHGVTRKELAAEKAKHDETQAALSGRVELLVVELAAMTSLHEAAAARRDELDATLERERLESADEVSWHRERWSEATRRIGAFVDDIDEAGAAQDEGLERLEAQHEAREAMWSGLAERRDGRHDGLQLSRDELQARFDWLLTRWKAREPRPADVELVAALRDELERQLLVTEHAVKEGAKAEERLRSLQRANRTFGGVETKIDEKVSSPSKKRPGAHGLAAAAALAAGTRTRPSSTPPQQEPATPLSSAPEMPALASSARPPTQPRSSFSSRHNSSELSPNSRSPRTARVRSSSAQAGAAAALDSPMAGGLRTEAAERPQTAGHGFRSSSAQAGAAAALDSPMAGGLRTEAAARPQTAGHSFSSLSASTQGGASPARSSARLSLDKVDATTPSSSPPARPGYRSKQAAAAGRLKQDPSPGWSQGLTRDALAAMEAPLPRDVAATVEAALHGRGLGSMPPHIASSMATSMRRAVPAVPGADPASLGSPWMADSPPGSPPLMASPRRMRKQIGGDHAWADELPPVN